jgi:hypothetical protein
MTEIFIEKDIFPENQFSSLIYFSSFLFLNKGLWLLDDANKFFLL